MNLRIKKNAGGIFTKSKPKKLNMKHKRNDPNTNTLRILRELDDIFDEILMKIFGKTKDELSLFMMNDPYTKKRLILEHMLWYFYIFLLTENENVDNYPELSKSVNLTMNTMKENKTINESPKNFLKVLDRFISYNNPDLETSVGGSSPKLSPSKFYENLKRNVKSENVKIEGVEDSLRNFTTESPLYRLRLYEVLDYFLKNHSVTLEKNINIILWYFYCFVQKTERFDIEYRIIEDINQDEKSVIDIEKYISEKDTTDFSVVEISYSAIKFNKLIKKPPSIELNLLLENFYLFMNPVDYPDHSMLTDIKSRLKSNSFPDFLERIINTLLWRKMTFFYDDNASICEFSDDKFECANEYKLIRENERDKYSHYYKNVLLDYFSEDFSKKKRFLTTLKDLKKIRVDNYTEGKSKLDKKQQDFLDEYAEIMKLVDEIDNEGKTNDEDYDWNQQIQNQREVSNKRYKQNNRPIKPMKEGLDKEDMELLNEFVPEGERKSDISSYEDAIDTNDERESDISSYEDAIDTNDERESDISSYEDAIDTNDERESDISSYEDAIDTVDTEEKLPDELIPDSDSGSDSVTIKNYDSVSDSDSVSDISRGGGFFDFFRPKKKETYDETEKILLDLVPSGWKEIVNKIQEIFKKDKDYDYSEDQQKIWNFLYKNLDRDINLYLQIRLYEDKVCVDNITIPSERIQFSEKYFSNFCRDNMTECGNFHGRGIVSNPYKMCETDIEKALPKIVKQKKTKCFNKLKNSTGLDEDLRQSLSSFMKCRLDFDNDECDINEKPISVKDKIQYLYEGTRICDEQIPPFNNRIKRMSYSELLSRLFVKFFSDDESAAELLKSKYPELMNPNLENTDKIKIYKEIDTIFKQYLDKKSKEYGYANVNVNLNECKNKMIEFKKNF